MKRDFDKWMTERLAAHPSVLMHACCGPCATSVTERLKDECRLTLFWYNPNIMPQDECRLRRENLEKVAAHFSVPLLDLEGDEDEFLTAAKGMETEAEGGKRCDACFVLRLTQTAVTAKAQGFDCFSTTLTVSPHKNAERINEIGEKIGEQVGIEWLYSDFKKKNGYLRSIQLSKELDLYRQIYCGCAYGRQGKN